MNMAPLNNTLPILSLRIYIHTFTIKKGIHDIEQISNDQKPNRALSIQDGFIKSRYGNKSQRELLWDENFWFSGIVDLQNGYR